MNTAPSGVSVPDFYPVSVPSLETAPDAKLELFDSGHSPHSEHPEAFVAVVREFFEGKR